MSDAFWMAFCGAIGTAVVAWINRGLALRLKAIEVASVNRDAAIHEVKAVVVEQAANIVKIEVATNSMKDALVEATRKAGHADGMADERANPMVPAPVSVNKPKGGAH